MWVTYSATLAMQLLFARRFGATVDASAYAVAMTVAVAIHSIVGTSVQTVITPILLDSADRVRRTPLRLVLGAQLIEAIALLSLAVPGSPLPYRLAELGGLPIESVLIACTGSAAFMSVQNLTTTLTVLGLALDRPARVAAAAASPALIAGIVLGVVHDLRPGLLYASLVVGSFVEVVVLLSLAARRHTVSESAERRGDLEARLVGTGAQLALLASIPPLERLLAGHGGLAGPAQFNYASRGLSNVLQLVVGGLVTSSLSRWSVRVRGGGTRSQLGVAEALTGALLALAAAGAIAAITPEDVVRVVYERGEFTASDTRAVAQLLQFGAVGFVAEGAGLIISQSLAALRMNTLSIGIGVAAFALRVSLMFTLSTYLGVAGLMLAYTISIVVVVLVQLAVAVRLGLLPARGSHVDAVAAAMLATLTTLTFVLLDVGAPVVRLVAFIFVLAIAYAGLSRARAAAEAVA